MKKFIVALGIILSCLIILSSCGKKNDQPQTKQSIVPAKVFASIPGQKVGN